MAKHGKEGLGYEIVKAVLKGDIVEPITYNKVKQFCLNNNISASENHMRVILANASENTHSPNYKKYFERVGRGEYIILPEFKIRRCYYWLNVDSGSYEWSFSDLKVGRSQTYSNLNPNGNKRKNEVCFKGIKIGDQVVSYETGQIKAITAICEVVDKYEEDNEIFIVFKKTRDYYKYLDINSMKEVDELSDCEIVYFHRGTLFQLSEDHFFAITKLLEGLNLQNDSDQELYAEIKQSLNDDPLKRKSRLSAKKTQIPESYEVKTKMYKRDPDVIAEVLIRASGICEKCNREAPFKRAIDGTPYLEVHHKIRLADGGEDTVENAVAVCPNCHRELHYGCKQSN
jgi:predicted HNH restriction endonuclease